MNDKEFQQMQDGKRAIECLEMHGFRRCDIMACNCGSWHGGHARNRLSEIGDALASAGLYHRGKTLLQEVQSLIDEHEMKQAQEGLDAWECRECFGRGEIEVLKAVTHQLGTDMLPFGESCEVCEGLGYCGPDASAMSKAKAPIPTEIAPVWLDAQGRFEPHLAITTQTTGATDGCERLRALLHEARCTLEMWKDVAPAVSLCRDIDATLKDPPAEQAALKAQEPPGEPSRKDQP